MQADQRDAGSRLLEVEAMRPLLQRHVQVAADDRVDLRRHQCASSLQAPRRRQHALEVEEMGHQRIKIAFDAELAAFGEREQVVKCGGGNGSQN